MIVGYCPVPSNSAQMCCEQKSAADHWSEAMAVMGSSVLCCLTRAQLEPGLGKHRDPPHRYAYIKEEEHTKGTPSKQPYILYPHLGVMLCPDPPRATFHQGRTIFHLGSAHSSILVTTCFLRLQPGRCKLNMRPRD